MKLKAVLPALSATLFLGILSGCASHSLREGVWELSLDDVEDYWTKSPVVHPKQRVKLAIDWKSDGDGEVVEIQRTESDLSPLYGDVFGTGKSVNTRKIRINGTDHFYIFRFDGIVRDPETISGLRFLLRHRFEENTSFTGRWNMKWISEG